MRGRALGRYPNEEPIFDHKVVIHALAKGAGQRITIDECCSGHFVFHQGSQFVDMV